MWNMLIKFSTSGKPFEIFAVTQANDGNFPTANEFKAFRKIFESRNKWKSTMRLT